MEENRRRKITEKYDIVKGDTLYDISKRLFGDPKYWPKIWALNNGKILNPHFILPGHSISFVPGTGTSLPSVNVAENEQTPGTQSDAEAPTHMRSQEWKLLGPQPWEQVSLALPPEVDPLGFDSRSRVKTAGANGFDPPMMAATQKLQSFGLIFAGEKEANYISLDDLVFIHGEGDVHIGQTYSLTTLPEKLTNHATDREGYLYPLLGKVKILQQRDGAFIGIITNVKTPIERGAMLIPAEPKIPEMLPIPGPNAVEGVIILDPENSTSTAAQHKLVFIDRGSDDGVSPGMVFRNYQRIDPNNSKRATHSNLMITADIMVVQSSPRFSMGLVMSGATYLTEGTNAVLLTDVSDLLKNTDPIGCALKLERVRLRMSSIASITAAVCRTKKSASSNSSKTGKRIRLQAPRAPLKNFRLLRQGPKKHFLRHLQVRKKRRFLRRLLRDPKLRRLLRTRSPWKRTFRLRPRRSPRLRFLQLTRKFLLHRQMNQRPSQGAPNFRLHLRPRNNSSSENRARKPTFDQK